MNRCLEPGTTGSLSQAMNDNTQIDTEILEAFDFHQQCIFCKQDASELFVFNEKKKPQEKRSIVRNIRRKETGDKIVAVALSRDDKLSEEIRKRIQGVDLLINEARYHKNCFLKFMAKYQKKNLKKGRPVSKEVSENLQQIYDYIEAEMDAHFSIAEIRELLEIESPDSKTIRRRLMERYGDKLCAFTTKENTEIFCFVSTTAHKALLEEAFEEEQTKRRKMSEVMQTAILENENDSSVEKCRICGFALHSGEDEIVTVKKRGQIRLKNMSELRKDSIFPEISEEPVLLHSRCRQRYKTITKTLERQFPVEANNEKVEVFDFQLQCIFCKKVTSDHFLNEEQKLFNDETIVCCNLTKETADHIISASFEYNDDWSEEVRKIIRGVDPVANNAKYHETCYSKFLNPKRPKSSKLGLPILEEVNEKMQHVYQFLEANMDAEFSLSKIRESLDIELPDNRTIKRKLLEHYGNKLFIVNSMGSKEMFCLSNSRQRSYGNDTAVEKTKSRKFKSTGKNSFEKKHEISISDTSNGMQYPTCRICESSITCDIVNVGVRGQKRLIHASYQRQDSKFKLLEDNLQLHMKCRAAYINERRIETRKRVSGVSLNNATEFVVLGKNECRSDASDDLEQNEIVDNKSTVSKDSKVMKKGTCLDNEAFFCSNEEWSDEDDSDEAASAASSPVAFESRPVSPYPHSDEDERTAASAGESDNADEHYEAVDDLKDKPSAYDCKLCFRNITGARYRCIVCPNLDICSECEHRGLHAAHYVLRVPPHRPMEEVNSILVAVLQALVAFKVPDLDKEKGPSQVKSVNSTRVKNVAPKQKQKQRRNETSRTGYNPGETKDGPAEKDNSTEELEVPVPILIKDEIDPLDEDLHQKVQSSPQKRPEVFVEVKDHPPVKKQRDNNQMGESSLCSYEMGGQRSELMHMGYGNFSRFSNRKSESNKTERSSKKSFTVKKPNR